MDIKKLLESMTLQQKIFQLLALNACIFAGKGEVDITGPVSELTIDLNLVYEAGGVLNTIGAERMKTIQDTFLEKNSAKIPLLFMQDVIHGHKTIYPINLGLAASFDRDLERECAAMAAKEASVDGISLTYAPMVDLARDARWGRVMETSGEDPYLSCEMAKATVEGFQGDMGKYNIATCVKHFAAYGGAEAGRDYNTVDMSERTLREFYLPAYKAAIDAGAKMLMTSFNSLNGIPASGNKKLLKDILRDEWGFEGVVISDYNSIIEMITHGTVENRKEAALLSMDAGLDVEMASTSYAEFFEELIKEGKITEEQVDRAVERVLKLKEDLGLFENPYRSASEEESSKIILCDKHREIARRAARESAVLLKNDNILPFSDNVKSVAVIGPHANTGSIHGFWYCGGRASDTVTVFDGIKKVVGDRAKYAKGCEVDITSTDTSMIAEAVELARNSEVVILTLGEHQFDSGEGNSKTNIEIPEVQYKLLDEILKVNKNVAVLLFTGRPLAIERLSKTAPAILNMWMPGTEAGNAVADLVFGKCSPSGKLTMCFPYNVGQCPIYYNHYNTGRPRPEAEGRFGYISSYIDAPNKPLYPFGYGLSYSTFEYSDFKLSSNVIRRGESVTCSVKVKNTGNYKAKESVQFYIRDCVASVIRPVKELKGFEKIELEVGEEKTVEFTITEDTLAFFGADLKRRAENGKFLIFIGRDSTCKHFAELELK